MGPGAYLQNVPEDFTDPRLNKIMMNLTVLKQDGDRTWISPMKRVIGSEIRMQNLDDVAEVSTLKARRS